MIKKTTYKILLNFHGELHEFYTTSLTREIAINNAIDRLGRKLKVSGYSIRNHLYGKDKIAIHAVKQVNAS